MGVINFVCAAACIAKRMKYSAFDNDFWQQTIEWNTLSYRFSFTKCSWKIRNQNVRMPDGRSPNFLAQSGPYSVPRERLVHLKFSLPPLAVEPTNQVYRWWKSPIHKMKIYLPNKHTHDISPWDFAYMKCILRNSLVSSTVRLVRLMPPWPLSFSCMCLFCFWGLHSFIANKSMQNTVITLGSVVFAIMRACCS